MQHVEQLVGTALDACPGVVSAYLFGSFAEGRQHAQSDIDIGVLLDRERFPTPSERFEARVVAVRFDSHVESLASLNDR